MFLSVLCLYFKWDNQMPRCNATDALVVRLGHEAIPKHAPSIKLNAL